MILYYNFLDLLRYLDKLQKKPSGIGVPEGGGVEMANR